MPKLKTNKAVRKRFSVTAKRNVLALKTKRRHLMTDRNPSRKRHARKKWTLAGVNRREVLRGLPYG